jgi:LCP family protein required for cell wall assembly
MGLPGEESPSRLEALFAETKWERARRRMFRGAAVMMVLVITLGGLLFTQGYFKLHQVFRGSAAALDNKNPDQLKGEDTGRVNILLMGRGGAGHDAPDLTDTMMLASVDVINHKATLVSLPRDMWVNVPGAGVMKLNAVFETGEFNYIGKEAPGTTDPRAIQAGYDLADQAVEDVLGVDVHYNLMVNFQAFRQAVDSVGGVNVDVPKTLVDPTMAWENNNSPVIAKAGEHKFGGAKALRYVRSRETTSDFSRAERQRAVLVALKSKIVSLGTLSNPLKLSHLINSFGNNVDSDLSVKNAQRLYGFIKEISSSGTGSVGFDSGNNPLVTTGNIDGQSVVLPKAGLFRYGDIHRFIKLHLRDPFLVQEKANVLVLNGTLIPDLAAKQAKELKKYGYNVSGVGNTPSAGWKKTRLIDLSGGSKKRTRNALEQNIGVTAATKMPDQTIQTNGADFVIIVGSDETVPAHPQTN